MKKIVLFTVLAVSMLGFSGNQNERYVKKCRVTSVGRYKNGTRYMNCTSLESGKNFNFIEEKQYTVSLNSSYGEANFKKGRVFAIWFVGNGYKNLQILDFRSEN